MNRTARMTAGLVGGFGLIGLFALPGRSDELGRSKLDIFPNSTGYEGTLDTGGNDKKNPFFQSLGTNGRACVHCHQADAGWTITPAAVQARFDASDGTDPIFRTNDGSNSPNADVSTVAARKTAYSMLLTRGVIRIGIGVPDDAEFTLDAVSDPYGFASAAELSLFRRPLPAVNVVFLTDVMWDGRESLEAIEGHPKDSQAALDSDLRDQANSATLGHAQARRNLTAKERRQIVDFQSDLFSAQLADSAAGRLDDGASGGPIALSRQAFFVGINDPFGADPTGAAFDPKAFILFDKWANPPASTFSAARAAVNRGQTIFNTKTFNIAGVGGLNDDFNKPVIVGTCTTCHNAPNIGSHSRSRLLNIGLAGVNQFTPPDLPRYTLKNNTTGATVQSTDPGRAMITGKWADIGKFKVPVLRNLAARAPYFHAGSAADLTGVVNFYNGRFGIGLTAQEKSDLVAFLRSL